MKRLIELVRPHWGTIALAGLCSLVVSGLNGVFAWIVKDVVDNVFVKGDRGVLLAIASVVVGAFALRGIFDYIQNYLMFSVGARIVRDVRDQLYARLVILPLGYFGSDTKGSLMTRIITDAGVLQELLAFRVRDLFVCTGTIIVLTGVALYRRWDLTVIALGVLPFAFVLVGRHSKDLKALTRSAQAKLGFITDTLSEGIAGIKVIKAFGVEDAEGRKFARRTDEYYLQYMRNTRIIQITVLIMECVAGIGVSLIIYYGGLLISGGKMTSGEFFSFMAAVLMIYTPAKRLAAVHNGLQQAKAYVSRIDEVLFSEPEPQGDMEPPRFLSEIVYESVRFRYEGREEDALAGIDLRIKKGEVVALVGRSGSGKTTLVDLLARFYIPQSGRILIDGVDINRMTTRALRSQIGIVSQHVVLFNDTVRANIAFGRQDADEEQVGVAARAAFAEEFILELPNGYDTVIGEGGSALSGGQRQRLSIARAILMDPSILILDEATSALDTQSEMMVQKALDAIIESSASGIGASKTVIVIAHRLSTLKRADRIIVIERGRVIESGSHNELMQAGGLYSHLYTLQHGGQGYNAIDVSTL